MNLESMYITFTSQAPFFKRTGSRWGYSEHFFSLPTFPELRNHSSHFLLEVRAKFFSPLVYSFTCPSSVFFNIKMMGKSLFSGVSTKSQWGQSTPPKYTLQVYQRGKYTLAKDCIFLDSSLDICLFIWYTQLCAIHPNTIEFVLGMVLCLDVTLHIDLSSWMAER